VIALSAVLLLFMVVPLVAFAALATMLVVLVLIALGALVAGAVTIPALAIAAIRRLPRPSVSRLQLRVGPRRTATRSDARLDRAL
jgi:hypothetical protein